LAAKEISKYATKMIFAEISVDSYASFIK